MLDSSDITPFIRLTENQVRIVIDDVEAELGKIAPSLTTSDDPTVLRVLRTAAIRYGEYLKTGARKSTRRDRTRGPFTTSDQLEPTSQPSGADIFTASEAQRLRDLASIIITPSAIALPVGYFPPYCGPRDGLAR